MPESSKLARGDGLHHRWPFITTRFDQEPGEGRWGEAIDSCPHLHPRVGGDGSGGGGIFLLSFSFSSGGIRRTVVMCDVGTLVHARSRIAEELKKSCGGAVGS